MLEEKVVNQVRFRKIKESSSDSAKDWILLPGGPGMDSSYLQEIPGFIDADANFWLMDLPGNGDHLPEFSDFSKWQSLLLSSISQFFKPILVGHSFGGMLIQSVPEIESRIFGLVLISTSPGFFFERYMESAIKNKMPDMSPFFEEYAKKPSNEAQKEGFILCAPYFFNKNYQEQGIDFLKRVVFNHKPFDWAQVHFYPKYKKAWVPQSIPTLIIGGKSDYMTPFHFYSDDSAYGRPNIELFELNNVAHFPWVEDSAAFSAAFANYT